MNQKTIGAILVATFMVAGALHAQTYYYEAWGGFDTTVDPTTDPFPAWAYQDNLTSPDYDINGNVIASTLTWGNPLGTAGPFDGKSGAIVNWPVLPSQYPSGELDGIQSDHVIRDQVTFVDAVPGMGSQSEPFLLAAVTHINQPIEAITSPPTSWDSWGKAPFRYQFNMWNNSTGAGAPAVEGALPDDDLLFWESLNSIGPGGTVTPPALDPAYTGDPWTTVSQTDDLFQVSIVDQDYLFPYDPTPEWSVLLSTSGWFEAPNLTGQSTENFWTVEADPNGSTFVASGIITIVPEPSTWAFLILGLGVFGIRRFRKS